MQPQEANRQACLVCSVTGLLWALQKTQYTTSRRAARYNYAGTPGYSEACIGESHPKEIGSHL